MREGKRDTGALQVGGRHGLAVGGTVGSGWNIMQPHAEGFAVGHIQHAVGTENHALVIGKLPGGHVALERTEQAGEYTLLGGSADGLYLPYLTPDFLHVLRGLGGQIQFIAEIAAQGHVAPHPYVRNAADLVIGHGGHVSAHSAGGIAQAGAVLDGEAGHGVGVVAGPGLGHVMQHPRVKASAAAGAAFKQHLGESLGDGFQYAIQA